MALPEFTSRAKEKSAQSKRTLHFTSQQIVVLSIQLSFHKVGNIPHLRAGNGQTVTLFIGNGDVKLVLQLHHYLYHIEAVTPEIFTKAVIK